MRKQYVVEERQQQEMIRKNLIRRAVRTIPCRSCGAKEDTPCTGVSGGLRVHNHQERMEDAKSRRIITLVGRKYVVV